MMSTGSSKRKRPLTTRRKGIPGRILELLHLTEFWQRIGICALAILLMWVFTEGWQPPFTYRKGYVPDRDLYSRVAFQFPDWDETELAQQDARRSVLCYYENDQRLIEEMREALANQLFRITGAKSFEELDPTIIDEFFDADVRGQLSEQDRKGEFDQLRKSLQTDPDGSKIRRAIEYAMLDYQRRGLLNNLEHSADAGSMQRIQIYQSGNLEAAQPVEVSEVRFPEIADQLRDKLQLEMKKEFDDPQIAETVADRVFFWIKNHIPVTLRWNEKSTYAERDRRASEVDVVMKQFNPGDRLERRQHAEASPRGIEGGQPLEQGDIDLMRAEHRAFVKHRDFWSITTYSFASLGMYVAAFALCGFYLYYQDRRLLMDFKQLLAVVATASVTICTVWLITGKIEWWYGQLIPIVMFTMTISIAYRQELGFFLTAVVSFVATMATGQGLADFVVMIATSSAAAMLCGMIRSRTRLVYVGIIAAIIGFPTAIGVQLLDGHPVDEFLLYNAAWVGFSAVIAGLLMTALLPFLEKFLGLETDISLLEIGDAAHPLLQELVRRAPGTYNHSINVASIAEAAAESIGANGLLCRVGAYFHDIGKMRKPEYFIENQGGQGNKHESLVPAMSTLVIIAHVKDGAEMAREFHLPQRIIDLIEQHHGTTLVEYFYLRAAKICEESGGDQDVDESSFRYPGPKPQTKEAAVMMLSDAVESACRTLVDPAPARIESLVHEISRKRLDDGQFDECPLTLKHIKLIEASLIKSMTAVYHGRVKYPDQQSA